MCTTRSILSSRVQCQFVSKYVHIRQCSAIAASEPRHARPSLHLCQGVMAARHRGLILFAHNDRSLHPRPAALSCRLEAAECFPPVVWRAARPVTGNLQWHGV